jgi:hypothetical protein
MTARETLTDDEAAAITAETLRLNDRYVRELVEGFNVCPFARGARVGGRTDRVVLLQRDLDVAPGLAEILRYESQRDDVEIVQMILPRVTATPAEFEAFVGRLRDARAERPPKAPFALACFHPDFKANTANPDTLVAFFRKAPHPMIQLVRLSVLDAINADAGERCPTPELIAQLLRGEGLPIAPSIAARITRDNFERVQREGLARFEALFASLAEDRARSVAR